MQKLKNIEFLRFIFSILIVYAHIIWLFIAPPEYYMGLDFRNLSGGGITDYIRLV